MDCRQVDQIYLQARSIAPGDRKSFLDQACAGDANLRLEVERRLQSDTEAGSFLDKPALEIAAKALAGDLRNATSADLAGRTLSHYRILEKVGEGGMGIVYRAHDEHLQRDVAVKVLPPGTLGNQSAKKRFRKEALALSRLNHPNIETVYDFDTQDGIDFLVMEYLAGAPLSHRLRLGPLPGAEVARLGEQLAEGLEAAHAQGIVHCDLKPGNLVLAADGRLKILDFGLARLLKVTSETPSMQSLSEAGGTVPYMSPEQLRGEIIDARSDLFSCGAVLYEMATGKRAFEASTPALASDAILRRAPTAPARINPQVPSELERIILKALEKNPQKRYQFARELLHDLRLHSPISAPSRNLEKRHKRSWMVYSTAWGMLCAGILLAFTWLWIGWGDYPLPEPKPSKVTGMPGWASEAVVSPDGNRIVYTSNSSGNKDIWLADWPANTTVPLTNDPADDSSPAWFPDGKAIAFVKEVKGTPAIWTLDLANRKTRPFLSDAKEPSVSPDGKNMAYTKASSSGYFRVFLTSISNPGDVRQLTDDRGGLWDHSSPAWSPDGKDICYSSRHGLWFVRVSDGSARPLTSDYELDFDPAWSYQTPYIYFSSYRGGTLAIWRVKSSGGKPERVTMGTGPESHPSIPRNGKRLFHTNGTQSAECILLDRNSGKSSVVAGAESDFLASIARDGGRIAYASRQGGAGSMNLWIQEFNKGIPADSARQLTRIADKATYPALSPNGDWIAFYRIIREQRDIWIVSIDGGDPLRFTDNSAADMYPAWSPDGSTLAFSSERAGGCGIWIAKVKNGIRNGPEQQLTIGAVRALMPAWSPDGSRIAFTGEIGGHHEAYVVPARIGSEPERLTDGADVRQVRWDPISGDLIASATNGTDRVKLWQVSAQNRSLRPFSPEVDFGEKNALWGMFDFARESPLLIFARGGIRHSQIWTLEAQKGVY